MFSKVDDIGVKIGKNTVVILVVGKILLSSKEQKTLIESFGSDIHVIYLRSMDYLSVKLVVAKLRSKGIEPKIILPFDLNLIIYILTFSEEVYVFRNGKLMKVLNLVVKMEEM